MGIRVNNLVRASVSKIAHAWHANPEMLQKVELARERASRNSYLNCRTR